MKKYILVKMTQEFFDGHGEGEAGEVELYTEHTDEYNDFDFSETYWDSWEESKLVIADIDEEDGLHAEDGYHCTREFYNFKEITEEQYHAFNLTLVDYARVLKFAND